MNSSERILVLGLGGAGTRTILALQNMPEASAFELYAYDTDRAVLALDSALPADHRILSDEQWLSGLGAGGDAMKGQRAMTRESNRMRDLLQNAHLVVVTGGLGGGTATGGAEVLARLAHSMNVPIIFLFELPFAFEGHGRRKTAEDGMRALLELSGTVLAVPNDLLFAVLPAETPFAEAFQLADVELARTILGVIDLLSPGNLLSADLGDLSNLLKNQKSYAAIGIGTGISEIPGEACRQALANLADSPFLGGAAKLKEADAVLLNVTGGTELTLAELKRTLDNAGTLPGSSARVLVGAGVRDSMHGQVRLTAIAIKFDEREAVDNNHAKAAEAAAPKRRRRTLKEKASIQPSLPLPIPTSGIFEGRTETIVDGVKLDIPTFLRQQIAIDTGE